VVVSSDFAEGGNTAHAMFARALRLKLPAAAVTQDETWVRPLDLALDAARRILGSRSFLVESPLPALAGLPMVWGTPDVTGFSAGGPIELILDLKFGEGLLVESDTVQLGIYSLLAARCFGVVDNGVTVWVLQPRHDHKDGLARPYHYSRADLDKLETTIRDAAKLAYTPNAPRKAGPWCRWCAASADCAERQAAGDAIPRLPSGWFRPRPRWLQPTQI
jgi:hypothetical protein